VNIFIGIDPGKTGGIASIKDGHAATVRMPKTRHLIEETLHCLCQHAGTFCTVEIQHVMGIEGRKTAFTIGFNYGFLLGILEALGVRFQEVRAVDWQAEMFRGLPKAKTRPERKARSKEIAEQLYRLGKITDGESDALLIAEFGRRTWQGNHAARRRLHCRRRLREAVKGR
jgi:hypothetical protein